LRGPHRSRSIESVLTETHQLAQTGVKEINLIAQDLTAYGRDRKDGTTLYGLLREMSRVDDLYWIRLLYSYPNFLDPELLDLIASSGKICKYVDIPFHISRPCSACAAAKAAARCGKPSKSCVKRFRD
jgi:ribosomal protein S12 methylthiotransferase